MLRKSYSIEKILILLLFLLFGGSQGDAFAKNYTLAWNPNPEPDVIGYKLFYRANGPIKSTGLYDNAIDVGNVTQYTVTGLDADAAYHFALKAYDLAGGESPFSEDAATGDNPDPVKGDINGDGVVDVLDLVAVVDAFGAAAADGDLDGNGVVDAADLVLAVAHYSPSVPDDGGISHVIAAGAGPGGIIFPESVVEVGDGGGRTFLISPEKGYVVDEVLVDGIAEPLTGDGAYRFDEVMDDHTIEVRFAPTAELADELVLRMDFSGDLQDASGWEHHGASPAPNTPIFTRDRYGRPGKAAQFDGLDDFARIESSVDFNLSEYTLAAWVYGTRDYDDEAPQYIVSNNAEDTDDVVGMSAFADSLCAPGAGVPRAEEVLAGKEYRWLHLAVVRSIFAVEFYLDGVYLGEMPGGSYDGANLLDLIIGARSRGDAVPDYGFFKGILDDVRLYSLPLSEEEIQDMLALPGDVNRDGRVDEVDLSLLAAAYGSSEGAVNWNPAADLDGNGHVGAGDLAWATLGFHSPSGTFGGDTLIGSPGDDTLTGLDGDDVIDGAEGIDTAVYRGAIQGYLVLSEGTDHYIVIDLQPADGDDGRDLLNNIEYLRFDGQLIAIADAVSALEIIDDDMYYKDAMIGLPNGDTVSAAQAQLFRLYFGAMRRMPDDGGYAWWLDQMKQGYHDLRSVSACFIASPEFLGYLNAPDVDAISNAAFLTYMYQGVFGREPDIEGYNWWLNNLEKGYASKVDVFMGFLHSNEYVEQTLPKVVDYLYGIRAPVSR